MTSAITSTMSSVRLFSGAATCSRDFWSRRSVGCLLARRSRQVFDHWSDVVRACATDGGSACGVDADARVQMRRDRYGQVRPDGISTVGNVPRRQRERSAFVRSSVGAATGSVACGATACATSDERAGSRVGMRRLATYARGIGSSVTTGSTWHARRWVTRCHGTGGGAGA